MATNADGFTLVTKKHKRCGGKPVAAPPSIHWPNASIQSSNTVENVLQKIEKARMDVRAIADRFLSMLPQTFANIDSIVHYGIGNFSSCATSRYQFALLLEMSNRLKPKMVIGYDPKFTIDECGILKRHGNLMQQNDFCIRKAEDRTLFFMPHCGRPMYNNVIWANWDRMDRIAIFGNSFRKILESLTLCRNDATALKCVVDSVDAISLEILL